MQLDLRPAAPAPAAEATLDAVAAVLRRADRVLLTMHTSPDGDGLGSTLGLGLALEQAGKQVVVYNPDPVPVGLRFMPGTERVVQALRDDASFDVTVACDAGHPSRLGSHLPRGERRGIFINLDHHATTPRFGDLNFIDVGAAAVGVIAYRVLQRMGLTPDADAASALYVSLISDTGTFRYSNTDPEVLRIAADLVELGARPQAISSAIYESNSPARLRLLTEVLPSLELLLGGKVAAMTVSAEAVARAGTDEETADGFVSYPRSIAGVEVAVLLREEPGRPWRVSLRSRGRVDVARIAGEFGGGGHAAASGCSIAGSRDEIRAKLLAAIGRALPS